ncbi:uncharacterized protein LOC142355723 [Convolutriloba macropyga]|uniref:uncharacterized protein LOC142355723 n=1 Tax=Convolutriloba macropyga TaxID=536237 RepID=UPI003F51E7F2
MVQPSVHVQIPDDILVSMNNCGLAVEHRECVVTFLSRALMEKTADPFIKALKKAKSTHQRFKHVAEEISNDAKRAENDQNYRWFMQYIWSNYLTTANFQQKELMKLLNLETNPRSVKLRLYAAQANAKNYSFVKSVQTMPKESYDVILGNVKKYARFSSFMYEQPIGTARIAPKIRLAYSFILIAPSVLQNIQNWQADLISGIECFKRNTELVFTFASGIFGGFIGQILGENLGCALGGTAGAGCGRILGGVGGSNLFSTLAIELFDRELHKVFNTPKDFIIQNAYRHLQVPWNESSQKINEAYKRQSFALYRQGLHKYKLFEPGHNDWQKLQRSMRVIQFSRGEIDLTDLNIELLKISKNYDVVKQSK